MNGVRAWWARLSPTERLMIALGIPAVAVAAIIGGRRGKSTAKTDAAAPPVVYTDPAQIAGGNGANFDIAQWLTDWWQELPTQPSPGVVDPLETADPCKPGPAFDPSKCSAHQLLQACCETTGHPTIVKTMWERQVSVNSPELAAAGCEPCARAYVDFLLSKGAIPTGPFPPGFPKK